ncbi:MAG: glycosyltransferase family 1 protein [Deltaproteobacteria bacterium]|nr:glycosyltransferase family 1 protein [Deltaproteobacteria bacterium]
MKLNIAFCNTLSVGHAVPLIALAKILRNDGHHIFFVMPVWQEVTHDLVKREGFEIQYLFNGKHTINSGGQFSREYPELTIETGRVFNAYRPDMVFASQLFHVGKMGAEMAGVPLVNVIPNPYLETGESQTPFIDKKNDRGGFNEEMSRYWGRIHSVRAQIGLKKLPSVKFIQSDFANIILTEPDVPCLRRDLPDNCFIAGPMIDPDAGGETHHPVFDLMSKDAAKVFISLGTEESRHDEALIFFNKVAAVFAELKSKNIQAVFFIGSRFKKRDMGHAGDNCVICDSFVPQRRIISQADLVISHGGWNTVHEALYDAKPQIVFPIAGHQFNTADWVVNRGVGMRFNYSRFDREDLKIGILRLLEDKKTKKTVSQMSSRIRSPERVYNLIRYIEGRYLNEHPHYAEHW